MRMWDRGDTGTHSKGDKSRHLGTQGQDRSRDEKNLKKSAGSRVSSPLGSCQNLCMCLCVCACGCACGYVYVCMCVCGVSICVCMCVELGICVCM